MLQEACLKVPPGPFANTQCPWKSGQLPGPAFCIHGPNNQEKPKLARKKSNTTTFVPKDLTLQVPGVNTSMPCMEMLKTCKTEPVVFVESHSPRREIFSATRINAQVFVYIV
jgi:hypothetical protein